MLTALNTSTNIRFIFKCIREKNNFFVIQYLNNYFLRDDNIVDENGEDVFTNIIKYGSIQMIQYIFSSRFGVTPDVVDKDGTHMLFHIARRSDLDLVTTSNITRMSTSDLDMQHPIHGSLLNQCIASKNIRMISVLIERGVDVNAKDENADPVIFRCVQHGLLEISNLIITNENFDVNLRNASNETIIEVALIKNMLLHASMIIKKLPADLFSRSQTLKLMEICIEKRNTMMGWKLYSIHSCIQIQRHVRGFLCRRRYLVQ